MKTTIILYCFLFLHNFSCFHSSKKQLFHDQEEIKGIDLYYSFPIGSYNGINYNFSDSARMYFFKELVLYEQFNVNSSNTMERDSAGNTKILITLEGETESVYIGFKRGAVNGFYFGKNQEDHQQIKMDSFFAKKSIYFGSISKLVQKTMIEQDEKLLSSVKGENGELIETFIKKTKIPGIYNDTVCYYYRPRDEFEGIQFSLCKELDDAKKMKLFQFKAISADFSNSSDKTKKIVGEFLVGFNRDTGIKDEKTIQNLFMKLEVLYASFHKKVN